MAKVPFSKLQASVNTSETSVSYTNKNNEEIKFNVKHYLPMKEKLELVSNIINQSIDDNGFYNPMRVKLYMTLEIMYTYTNLSFTDKIKEDPFKLYDILISSGIYAKVVDCINENEWEDLDDSIWETINSIYKYKNSVMGILDAVSTDYSNLNLDAAEIQQKLADPENMQLLKDVLSKLG